MACPVCCARCALAVFMPQDPGAVAIAGALAVHTSLSRLDLSYNNIHNDGAVALANAIRANKYLISLNLSFNPIAADGLKALVEAIKANEDLKEVMLDGIVMDRSLTAAFVSLELTRYESCLMLLGSQSQTRSQNDIRPLQHLQQSTRCFGSTAQANRRLGTQCVSFSSVSLIDLFSVRAINSKRRSSIMITLDEDGNLGRRPIVAFSPKWTPEEAWLNGYVTGIGKPLTHRGPRSYNEDGSPRSDMNWILGVKYDPSWTAAQAWEYG